MIEKHNYIYSPQRALGFCAQAHGFFCRPLYSDSTIIMWYENGLDYFRESDNGIRIEPTGSMNPEWFLDGVKWFILPYTSAKFAFKNHEDPDLLKHLENTAVRLTGDQCDQV